MGLGKLSEWLKQGADGRSLEREGCKAVCRIQGVPGCRHFCGRYKSAGELDGHAKGTFSMFDPRVASIELQVAIGTDVDISLARLCGSKLLGYSNARCALGPIIRLP